MHEAALGRAELNSIEWAKLEFFVAMRKSGVPLELAERNLRALEEIIRFHPINAEALGEAMRLAYELNLHAADAVHLASCTRLGCKKLVTDDKHLLKTKVQRYLRRRAVEPVFLGFTRTLPSKNNHASSHHSTYG